MPWIDFTNFKEPKHHVVGSIKLIDVLVYDLALPLFFLDKRHQDGTTST
ncbi:MAG: hypothetical protein IPO07_31510 [Haliscomenobacter sp.]|nr:hypothetical protein [Haliscomenobacter sp.]MBK9492805.1 hypothetical protein [Haliscomenobacter sp.]